MYELKYKKMLSRQEYEEINMEGCRKLQSKADFCEK